ncbi:hypothetical protein D9613_000247 [Agrocybe pediades]|uniref:Minichromosome loss protein Mcl1 middle region domain-containing protein n=1 Tax=Agrocybe pediades TaxID=84607 RepID=A0A8H4R1S4_9AGAR|nr:hypothetical protein D9613_000247 [Agrocybe pediades]
MVKTTVTSPHPRGHTCLAFSRDGLRVFTGGTDSLVAIWDVDADTQQEPERAVEAEGPIWAIATADDCWVAGGADREVRRYPLESTEMEAIVTTMSETVRGLAIDPQGRKVAIASDELYVKVVDLEDIMKVDRLEGYTAGIRSVTWHPSGSLLATCTRDGKIVIWNMSAAKPVIEKTIEGIIPVVKDDELPEFEYDCSVVWHTSGDYFFVPSKAHEIVSISRNDWTKIATFSDKNVSGAVTALAISANGVYLASASQSKVHTWSTQTRRLISTETGEGGSTITSLAFSPTQNLIAWTDASGSFTRWKKPISDNFPHPVKASIATNGASTISVKPKTGLDLFAADDVQENAKDKDHDADVDLDDDMADIDDGWIVDDMDGALNEPPAADRIVGDGFVKEMVSITQAQPPFQPGSTPMENKKRYLTYNMIGVIEAIDQDTHNIINVQFFDQTLRKGFNFTDYLKYTMGCLGERGALFACEPENDHPAQVSYRPYNTKMAEWSYKLEKKGVRCLGIATGAIPLTSRDAADAELQGYGHVVIATTENDLTFLTGTGRERRIMPLPGDFVTMTASAEWLFVVHRAGSTTIDGSQNLSYTVINFEDFTVRQRDVLPVPKGHTLKWIGLTDSGAPAMYDSTGCLHILTKHRVPHHASWARVLDTNTLERRQGKDESYWPVGITESNFMCLILKGRQEHPTFPRPLIQELPIRLPFRHASAQEELVERETLFVEVLLDNLDDELTTDDIVTREKAMDREIIQLIQAACKASNSARAIELSKLLHHTATLDAAIKIADFYHLVGLKEKIGIIKSDREENEDRLIIARNKRRRWMKPDPPLRQLAATTASSSRFDPLGDVRPPPAIDRPGMARVTVPRIEKTRYTSVAAPSDTPERSTWADSSVMGSPPPSDSKRKRDYVEESFPSPDITMPPPKQKSNPFARKATQETNKNPFARKTDTSKTIHKSESFFDKVDAAETETVHRKRPSAKGKEKEKKDGPKQATLFGMMPKADKATKLGKKKAEAEESAGATESAQETQTETQTTDVVMDDAGLLEETQETQDAEETQVIGQREDSPDWDETQLAE